MTRNKLGIRYGILGAGVLLNGFGVAFITKAELGITPIASIPYTLSLIFPQFTLGNVTCLINLLLTALQAFLLGKERHWPDILLQVPVSFLFGYVIDFSMLLLQGFEPVHYIMKMFSMLLGCVIIAVGAYFEVTADVCMLPADGFAGAIAKRLRKPFGSVKMITDTSQAVIALLLGLAVLHQLAGVREGTVIGGILIGNLVKGIGRILRLDHRLGL